MSIRSIHRYFRSTSRFGAVVLIALVGVVANVAATEPAPSTTAHAAVHCADCHDGERTPSRAAASNHQCTRCHVEQLSTDVSQGNGFHVGDGRSCLVCHSFHEPQTLRVGSRRFAADFGNESVRAHCRSCHAPGLQTHAVSAGHRTAADLVYHVDADRLANLTPSAGCLSCHDSAGSDIVRAENSAPLPRFNTHASHPFGNPVTPGQGRGASRIRVDIDSRLVLFGGRIECQTCHRVTGSTADLLVAFDAPYALCLGCHDLSPHSRDDELLVANSSGR